MKLVSKLALGVAFVALAATGAARAETLDLAAWAALARAAA